MATAAAPIRSGVVGWGGVGPANFARSHVVVSCRGGGVCVVRRHEGTAHVCYVSLRRTLLVTRWWNNTRASTLRRRKHVPPNAQGCVGVDRVETPGQAASVDSLLGLLGILLLLALLAACVQHPTA